MTSAPTDLDRFADLPRLPKDAEGPSIAEPSRRRPSH